MRILLTIWGVIAGSLLAVAACTWTPDASQTHKPDPSDRFQRLHSIETVSAVVGDDRKALIVTARGFSRGAGWTDIGLRIISPVHGGRRDIVFELVGDPPGAILTGALVPVEVTVEIEPPPTPRPVRVLSETNEIAAIFK